MNVFSTKLRLAFASLLLSALLPVSAFAMPVFVGSYHVNDGPTWGSNPDVYSGVEAAALIFGGLASDYRISIIDSMDISTITDTAWYSIVGVSGGHEYADDFSLDLLEDGYAGQLWVAGVDISAYVRDNAYGNNFRNYVWRDNAAAVSEPATLALVGLGIFGLGVVRRRKQQ